MLVDDDTQREVTATLVDVGLARSVRLDGKPRVRAESQPGGVQVVIAARDRLGLFGDTAGLLTAHSVSVRSAVLHTVEGVAVNTWRVDKAKLGDLPDPAFLSKELERLEAGDQSMLTAVQRREARVRAKSQPPEPYVHLVPDASEGAAVVEVRTVDRTGLLYALGRALAGQGLSIRSAHISTLAGQAIDTFYVTESDGRCPDAARAEVAVATLAAAAAGSGQLGIDDPAPAATSDAYRAEPDACCALSCRTHAP